LSHQFAWGSQGKVHELFATVKEFQLTEHRMIEHYKMSTGLDDDTIRRVLLPPQDVYLSAAEALEYGICDLVADLSH
jgi:ATP-dependent protease ClpP protease subunit